MNKQERTGALSLILVTIILALSPLAIKFCDHSPKSPDRIVIVHHHQSEPSDSSSSKKTKKQKRKPGRKPKKEPQQEKTPQKQHPQRDFLNEEVN